MKTINIVLALVFAALINVHAETNAPEYVPGEVLVNFTGSSFVGIPGAKLERVYPIEPVIARFTKDNTLEKDKDGWYWFRGETYKEVSQVPDEELFEEAYEAMGPAEQALHRTYKMTLPEGVSVEDAIRKLEENPKINYAEPNYIVRAQKEPNDPLYNKQWALYNTGRDDEGNNDPNKVADCDIDAPEAWDITTGVSDPAVVVAVIDSGVDYNHRDLRDNM